MNNLIVVALWTQWLETRHITQNLFLHAQISKQRERW